jgi:signal transduction histidine kinase/ligand-binding sensor domain-containing protein/CheY-like chemotaxis protein/AraC-like DNA-binding protein
MPLLRLFVFLCFYSFCFITLTAQPVSFQHFSVEQGLPNYSAISLTQDKLGFMWIGTVDGLCRYDGIRFKTYRSNANDTSSLLGNHIISLFTDSKGIIWIGTSTGLNKYDVKLDRFERIPFGINQVGSVFCIYEDSRGQIWVGSANGLYMIPPNGSPSVSFQNKTAGNSVRAILEDKNKGVWVGTDKGLTYIETVDNRYRLSHFSPLNSISGSPNANAVTALAQDENRQLWVGTLNNGIYQFDLISKKAVHYQSGDKNSFGLVNNNIRCLTWNNGLLWIGTQEGISVLNPVSRSFQTIVNKSQDKASLSQNSVYAIYKDANQSVWVGTYFGGVNVNYAYSTPFSVIQNTGEPNSISNNVISSIVEDRNHNLWIGTEGGGINFLNRTTKSFTNYKNRAGIAGTLGSNLVKVLYPDADGNIWAGTHGGGLNVLQPGSKTIRQYLIDSVNRSEHEITSIVEDPFNNFWVTSNRGIRLFKREGIALTMQKTPLLNVRGVSRYLYRDRDNNIWIAGSPGIYRLSGNIFKEEDSVLYVNCFTEDVNGNIWMGTGSAGLVRFDKKTKKLVKYTNSFLLPLNILGILSTDDQTLWLSTNKGLIHFHPQNNTYQVYTKNDGIAGNEFNYNSFLKSSDSFFYFGGYNGITYFRPRDIIRNSYIAPVVFTSLKLNNEEVAINDPQKVLRQNISLTTSLIFKHDQNDFTIDFALLNYVKTKKNRYRYMLEGFDKNWKTTSEGSATYTNLQPGSYRLVVNGANNDGVGGKTAYLQIKVNPPFWLTWWAYCLYILAAAAIVFIIARFFFLREVLKKEDELHQAKLNFFTNASHEIRTHLTLIMAPVERLLSENKKESFIEQQLTQVKSNTNRLLNLVGELMDFRKAETNHLQLNPKKQNLISFLQDIYESFREMSQSKNIHMSFVHDEDFVALNFDEQQLEKVFFNLLANAFKFTPEGGLIQLQVITRTNDVIIKVTDNGRGIAPQYLDKLFTNFFQVADHGLQNTGYGIGLALSKNIVTLHQGTISVESIPAKNEIAGHTVFTVVLPLNAQFPGIIKERAMSSTPTGMTPVSIIEVPSETTNTDAPDAGLKTVLVVEDNAELKQLVKNTLSHRYHVITAYNGVGGWEIACAEIPDIIISDVMMPEMDGYTLCKKIKTDERTSHIPVILLTAKSSQNEQVTGLEQGADLYLTKPFSTKVLTLSVLNLLAAQEKLKQKITRELTTLDTAPTLADNVIAADTMTAVDKAFLEKVIGLIDEHIDDPAFGVELLSKKVAMSAPVLYKKLRALTDMSVNEFIKLQRFKKAATLLQKADMTVNEVSFAVGYDDRKYFSREFKKYFHMTPSEFSSKSKS